MAYLDKCVMEFLDEVVLARLDEGIVEFLYKDNEDNFDLDIRNILDDHLNFFLITCPLEFII